MTSKRRCLGGNVHVISCVNWCCSFFSSNPAEWENTFKLGNVVKKKSLKCWTHRWRFWGTHFSWPVTLLKRIVMLWLSRSLWATSTTNSTHLKPKGTEWGKKQLVQLFGVYGFLLWFFLKTHPITTFLFTVIFMFFPQDPVLNDLYAVFRGYWPVKKSESTAG